MADLGSRIYMIQLQPVQAPARSAASPVEEIGPPCCPPGSLVGTHVGSALRCHAVMVAQLSAVIKVAEGGGVEPPRLSPYPGSGRAPYRLGALINVAGGG